MRAVITVISDVKTDRRVLKHSSLLKETGFDVTIIGRRCRNGEKLPEENSQIVRLRIPFSKGPLMYLAFNIRLFFSLLFRRADLYLANDLDTLLPAFMISKLFGRQLIYDSHEYFTGQHGLAERRLKHNVWKWIERRTLPRIKWMITVSPSIAALYKEEYGVSAVVVRNVSMPSAGIVLRSRSDTGAGDDDLLAVFQGSGINPGRGAEELIDAMALTSGVRLLIIGSGDAIDSVIKLAALRGVSDKVKFLNRMPWEEMMSYTRCCDVGLSLDKDTCVNQRYSLPNKLFDYISAGIPVIASPLTEVKTLVEGYGCGLILSEVTPAAIAETLNRVRDDKLFLASLKRKAEQAAEDLTWEKEKIREQDLLRSVINRVIK
ncbi:MAG: glycosyltransferase [Bacteroidales bacterium]|nr:glycosyltransferase [Bacteroidales bacterium]